jgi:hypothetical protein
MLALLIMGKKIVTSKNFDVYLQPLVEELQQLWTKVLTYDVRKPLGSKSFTLRGILIRTIHDFPGYGIVGGVAHQVFVACLVYGLEYRGEHSLELAKQTYIGTRRWLLEGHLYRSARMKDHFNGQLETCGKPNPIIAEEQLA